MAIRPATPPSTKESGLTSVATMLLPMLGACFVAMLVPTLFRNPPIYDSLRERTLIAKAHAR